MKSVPTYTAHIYVGLREGYDGPIALPAALERICRDYVDDVGLAVTFTDTHFIYTKGEEPGVVVGLIRYPRFPGPDADIQHHALALAKRLMRAAKQQRVSIVFTDHTVMLEGEDL